MRFLTKTATLAVAMAGMGLLGVSAARATPVTLSPSLSCGLNSCTASATSAVTQTEMNSLLGDGNTVNLFSSIVIPLFNSNLGTLTGATITLTAQENSSGTVTNTQAAPITGTASVSSAVWVTATGSLAGFNISSGTATLSGSTGTAMTLASSQTYSGGTSLQPGVPTAYSGSDTKILKDCLIFALGCTANDGAGAYQAAGGGSSTVHLSSNTFTGSNLGAGNATLSINTDYTLDLQVNYTFTPVCGTEGNPCPSPEPASMSLLGFGLVGIGAMIRRRRKAA